MRIMLSMIAAFVMTNLCAQDRLGESYSNGAKDIARLAELFDSSVAVSHGKKTNAPWGRTKTLFTGNLTMVLKGEITWASVYFEDQNGTKTTLTPQKAYKTVKGSEGVYPSMRLTVRDGKAELSLGQKELRYTGTINSAAPYRVVFLWGGSKWSSFSIDGRTPKEEKGFNVAKSSFIGKWKGPQGHFLTINEDGSADVTWGQPLPGRKWFQGTSNDFYVTRKKGAPSLWRMSKDGKNVTYTDQTWVKVE